MEKNNVIKNKSFTFALQIVKLSQYQNQDKKEYVLSKQILRSGTAIGALIRDLNMRKALLTLCINCVSLSKKLTKRNIG
uniref:four helix bundle protein n=1 Tax=Okeania sp. SIO2F4 TaxID=2607790 RepID=UPI0025CF8901|nr:four helix bundle protein [Okeania sp. SIO2F4]